METLGKIWVLWDVCATVDGDSKLELIFSDDDKKAFVEDAFGSRSGFDKIRKSLATFDVTSATWLVPADKELILSIIQSKDGVFNVNRKILGRLRKWFLIDQESIMRI